MLAPLNGTEELLVRVAVAHQILVQLRRNSRRIEGRLLAVVAIANSSGKPESAG